MELNIDATNATVGRLATFAAKQALLGNKVNIFNSEQAVVSGSRSFVLKKWHDKVNVRGDTLRGPFFSRMPDRLLRRVVRGMLPHRQPRGKEAFQRVMCYIGIPSKFKDVKLTKFETPLGTRKVVSLKEISKQLGAKQ